MQILSSDKYQIKAGNYFDYSQQQVLIQLYQPLVNYESISLYLTLFQELPVIRLWSDPSLISRLLKITGFDLESLREALRRLEGIGLVRTYNKDNYFIFELLSPLTPHKFFNNRFLKELLYTRLGEKDYWRTVTFFQDSVIDFKDFKEVTNHFKEVFAIDNFGQVNDIKMGLVFRDNKTKNLEDEYDFNLLLKQLEVLQISQKVFQAQDFKLIKQLGMLYQIPVTDMVNIVSESMVDQKFNPELFINKCRTFVKIKQPSKLKEVFQKQPPNKITTRGDKPKQKHIHYLETTNPYNLLLDKQGGKEPAARDLHVVESIMTNLDLNPGVMNVLIELTLVRCKNALPRAFMESVGGIWKREGIEDVPGALAKAKAYLRSIQQSSSEDFTSSEVEIDENFNWEQVLKGLR